MQHIITVLAEQGVVVVAAIQVIVAVLALQLILAALAVEFVVASVAQQDVVAQTAPQGVGTSAAAHEVVAVAGQKPGEQVEIEVLGVGGVVIGVEAVVAIGADQIGAVVVIDFDLVGAPQDISTIGQVINVVAATQAAVVAGGDGLDGVGQRGRRGDWCVARRSCWDARGGKRSG